MNETMGYVEMVERMPERKFSTKQEAKTQSMKLLNLMEDKRDRLKKLTDEINEEIELLHKAEESLLDYYGTIGN